METSVMREGYRVGKSANYNQIQIIGRSSPIITFGNSSPIEIGVNTEIVDLVEGEEHASDMVKSLLSLVFPEDPGIKPPKLCQATLGQEFVDWDCVVANVELNPGNRNIWGPKGQARTCQVGLTLIGVEIQNTPAKEYLIERRFEALAFYEDGGSVA